MEEKLTTLEKYGYIYHMVGMNPITRKELREKIKKDSPKMSETTLKKYSDAPFDGAYPMFVVKDDKATLDITAFRSFIEELCKYVGTDAAVLFTGPAPAPGGRKGDNPQIAKVPNKAENPQILIERKRNTELSKQIADLEKQIEELRLENQKIVADSVLANMSKEVNISTIRVFGKAVEEDIFLHNASDVLGEVRDVSKVGGIRQSFYVKDSDKAKELTVQNARSKVAEILFRSKFFEKLFHDSSAYEKKVSGKVDITATQMDANRRKSIELLLSDDKLSNRAKLALYAWWHEYHGTEMEDLLNYAGDHCLDANYVIRLLEKPDVANNYQNVRGFLRQACKASEARMKREAAKELIAGEWFVIAEYNGNPSNLSINPFRSLDDIGCLMYVSLDFRGISLKQSFTQALEQRYNRRISVGKQDDFANMSVSIFFRCDSDDARAIIEKTIITMFTNVGIALAPAFGAQRVAAESVISLGITDYSVMRNVGMEVVSKLGMYGGGLCRE